MIPNIILIIFLNRNNNEKKKYEIIFKIKKNYQKLKKTFSLKKQPKHSKLDFILELNVQVHFHLIYERLQ